MQPTPPNLLGFRRGLPFLGPRRSKLRSDRFELAAAGIGKAELVLARSLCRFSRFDLAQVPDGKRRGALRLKLGAWAPYADATYAVVWAGDQACVWCWDAARAGARLEQQGRRAEQFAVLPETLLQAPLADGLRLVRCLEGYEGQRWAASSLQDSRWWPAAPSAEEWLGFLRGSGVPPDAQVALPQPVDLPWQARPWAAVSGVVQRDDALSTWEPLALAALVLALGVPAVLLGARELQLHLGSASLEQQIAALRQTASPLLAAREAALATQQRIRTIEDLQRYPDALRVMAIVAEALPVDGVLLRDWELSEGNLKLTVVSATAAIAGTEHVAALEKTGYFQDVKMVAQADPRQMGFAMRLRALRETDAASVAGATRPPGS